MPIGGFTSLGKEATLDAYERVPIDQFGKNVLSRLGWKEGSGIGKST